MALLAGDYVAIRLTRTILADYQQRGVFQDLPKVPGEYLRPVAVAKLMLVDARDRLRWMGPHQCLPPGTRRAYQAVVRHLKAELDGVA